MSDKNLPDHWGSLASELGADPPAEPEKIATTSEADTGTPPRKPKPIKPKTQPANQSEPRGASNWQKLASMFGLRSSPTQASDEKGSVQAESEVASADITATDGAHAEVADRSKVLGQKDDATPDFGSPRAADTSFADAQDPVATESLFSDSVNDAPTKRSSEAESSPMDPLDTWTSYKSEDPSLEGLGLSPGVGFGPPVDSVRFEAKPFDEGIPLEAKPVDLRIDADADKSEGDDVETSSSTGTEYSERPKRKRRRGRRGGRRRRESTGDPASKEEQPASDAEPSYSGLDASDVDFDPLEAELSVEGVGNDDLDDDDIVMAEAVVSFDEEDDDDDVDGGEQESCDPPQGRRRRRSESEEIIGLTEKDRKPHPQIPSWEKAVGILVEANIENHASSRHSSRRGGGDDRPRRRRRSEGGRRRPSKRDNDQPGGQKS